MVQCQTMWHHQVYKIKACSRQQRRLLLDLVVLKRTFGLNDDETALILCHKREMRLSESRFSICFAVVAEGK